MSGVFYRKFESSCPQKVGSECERFLVPVEQMAEHEGITEQLKADNQKGG